MKNEMTWEPLPLAHALAVLSKDSVNGRTRTERIVSLLAAQTPAELAAAVKGDPDDARRMIEACDGLVSHHEASRDIAAAVKERIEWALTAKTVPDLRVVN